jgi:hypothetical protein
VLHQSIVQAALPSVQILTGGLSCGIDQDRETRPFHADDRSVSEAAHEFGLL